jgi:hypothetical protein
MDRNDRYAIETLFERLADVEQRNPRRDPDAEAFINRKIGEQPGAPYYLAQTVVVQQQALEAAQERIAELEASTYERSGRTKLQDWRRQPSRLGQPSFNNRPQPWGGGGGFLAGAAQTALGVAGGVLLGNMIAGALFGDNEAQAADQSADNDADADADAGDAGGFDAGGFDFGGGE